jgi:serine/threonine protein kinase
MSAHPQYSHGEVIANKYVVEGMVGEGPASVTYLSNSNAGRLAVKIYRPEVSAKLVAAPDFFLKAVIMTEIGHDNLAACLDVQEEMGQVFVARPFVEGESFEDWARKHRGEPGHFARGLELLWQVSQGLGALHERTRHLNIHPGNVIVGPVVAKLCDPDPRALGNTEMTPDPLPLRPEYRGYRAPEMAGRGAGFLSYPSSDLFAIGGLLYRLVKGEHPSSNPAQTLNDARGIDRDLALFLGKALHPKPEERFQDAGAFADALWELQAVMQRLQDRMGDRPAPAPVPPPPFEPVAAKEPTLFGTPAQPVGTPAKPADSDSFFDFFPSEPASATPASGAQRPFGAENPGAGKNADGFFPDPRKPGGDTLFGAPAVPSGQPVARTEPPRREIAPSAPSGGLADLEQPGTLFGKPVTPRSGSKSPFRNEPPPQNKPVPVSLSSLEKDPMEAAGSIGSGGFTTYGFKGAGDNRTGIYNPDGSAAAAKAKLRLLFGIAGGVAILAGLAALFIFLRSNAAEKAKPSGSPVAVSDESVPALAPRPAATNARSSAATGPAASAQGEPTAVPSQSSGDRPPYPEGAESGKNQAAPNGSNSGPATGYSEPPMPVEPARPSSLPEARAPSSSKPPKSSYQGNAHVTPEREAALMTMVQARDWPASAGERLKDADDLNDLGKTAEANLLYGKALIAEGVSEKQKVSALGGLAVTFQAMGMKAQAKDAVDKILAINPKNGFALKLRSKL